MYLSKAIAVSFLALLMPCSLYAAELIRFGSACTHSAMSNCGEAYAISASGEYVTGKSYDSGKLFIWSAESGIVTFDGIENDSYAIGVDVTSAGQVVGYSDFPSSTSIPTKSFIWDGIIQPTTLQNGQMLAVGISEDGGVVAGRKTIGDTDALKWSVSDGFEDLPKLGSVSYSDYSLASDVSGDGTAIVGESSTSQGFNEAVVWYEDGSYQGLGDLEGGLTHSRAFGVSKNGEFIVGISSSGDNLSEAFIWTLEDGMVGLGVLPGGDNYSVALAVSDNQLVIGISNDETGEVPFVWDQVYGMRSLKAILESSGVSLDDFHIQRVTDISSDGTKISGYGNTSGNPPEPFLIIIDPPVEPVSIPVPNILAWLLLGIFSGFIAIKKI